MSEITCNLFFKYFRSDKNHFYCFRVKKKKRNEVVCFISVITLRLKSKGSINFKFTHMWEVYNYSAIVPISDTLFLFPWQYEPSYITPGLTLMEKRNDKARSTLMPTERPRSYTFLGVDSGRKKGGPGENHEWYTVNTFCHKAKKPAGSGYFTTSAVLTT